MTEKRLHKGDEVTWSSHGATVEGQVVEEITKDTKLRPPGSRVKG